MNLYNAIEIFRRRADAGEIIDRKTGQPRALSAARQRVIVSNVSTALTAAACVEPSDVGGVELEPFAATLANIGRERAAERGRDNPRNVAANISLFLATVLGEYQQSSRHGYANRRPLTSKRVLPAWKALYDATVKLTEEDPKKRTFPGQLVAFHDLCLENGVRSPHDVPDDFETVSGWAKSAGMSDGKFGSMATAFRTARLRLQDMTLPTFYQRVRAQDRGLRSLPEFGDLLRAGGCTADPLSVPTQDAIRIIAPKIGAALDRHVADGMSRHLSPGWVEAQVGMTSRLLASALRLGHAPHSWRWTDLFELTVEVDAPAQVGMPTEEVDELIADVVGEGYRRATRISMLRHLADEAADASFARSPLERIHSQVEGILPGKDTVYTNRVQQDVMYAYMLTRAIFGEAIHKADPQRWSNIQGEYESLREHMTKQNERVRTEGHKDKNRILILWPQAVLLGLRALRQRVLEAEARKNAYNAKRGDFDTQTGRHLLKEFDRILKEYILAAVMLDDGLRIKNYAGAVAGLHLLPEPVRDRAGRWIGLKRMETYFRGYDAPEVSLKIDKDENGGERHRRRHLTPAIVDHRLLFVYWTESRPRDLVRRGVLATVAEFDPDSDGYAAFIAPRSGGKRKIRRTPVDERAKRTGRYTEDQLSTIIGKTLHWMVRDVLGRPGVPGWDDPARTEEWRGLFSAHITRSLLATYFGGIREKWVYACEVTDDTERTPRRNYVRIRSAVVAKMHADGIENPHHFDAVIDRMLAYRHGDNWDAFWDAFDPETPAAALEALRGVVPARPRDASGRTPRPQEGTAA